MLEPEWIFIFLLLGSFVGFMAGLLGIGGGGILVPILTTIFLTHGIAMDNVVHLALGTSMASMVITTFSSCRSHHAKGGVVWKAVKGMVLGIILGTFLATFLASHLSSLYLGVFFALFMAFVSSQMFLNKKPKPSRELSGNMGLFAAGSSIGAISALVSIGGGSLTVPYLTWQNVEIKKAIGTSAAIGLPINGWSNSVPNEYIFGYVYLPAVVLISITSFITAPYGAQMAHKLPVAILKKIFAVLLVILSVRMLISIL
jgi:uncharacterized membrane protein YfcA